MYKIYYMKKNNQIYSVSNIPDNELFYFAREILNLNYTIIDFHQI